MATIGDVAKRAGVSTTLVSRYLNGIKGVSPASKEKIEQAIRELQYVPDESARMLVRRRGGGSPQTAEPQQTVSLPAAIAMVCEDADCQLVASLYLGVKHTVWSDAACRGYQILLIVIPDGDMRALDEDETADYIRKTCKAVIGIAENSMPIRDKLKALALPTVLLGADDNSKSLHRGSTDLKKTCTELETIGSRIVKALCAAVISGTADCTEETLPCALTVLENHTGDDHSPVGRPMQSHLL